MSFWLEAFVLAVLAVGIHLAGRRLTGWKGTVLSVWVPVALALLLTVPLFYVVAPGLAYRPFGFRDDSLSLWRLEGKCFQDTSPNILLEYSGFSCNDWDGRTDTAKVAVKAVKGGWLGNVNLQLHDGYGNKRWAGGTDLLDWVRATPYPLPEADENGFVLIKKGETYGVDFFFRGAKYTDDACFDERKRPAFRFGCALACSGNEECTAVLGEAAECVFPGSCYAYCQSRFTRPQRFYPENAEERLREAVPECFTFRDSLDVPEGILEWYGKRLPPAWQRIGRGV